MPRELPQTFAFLMPLSERLIDRILYERKTVVAKYLPRLGIAARFRQGTTIVFYQSRKDKELVGEGTISNAQLMFPEAVLSKYGESFFLTEDELHSYADKFSNRWNKEFLVLCLRDVHAYDRPVTWQGGMTMAGVYLTRGDYIELVGQAKGMFSANPRLTAQSHT